MGMRFQPKVTFVGPQGEPGVEGSIDAQWIQAAGDNVPTTFWLDVKLWHKPELQARRGGAERDYPRPSNAILLAESTWLVNLDWWVLIAD